MVAAAEMDPAVAETTAVWRVARIVWAAVEMAPTVAETIQVWRMTPEAWVSAAMGPTLAEETYVVARVSRGPHAGVHDLACRSCRRR